MSKRTQLPQDEMAAVLTPPARQSGVQSVCKAPQMPEFWKLGG